MIFVVLFLLAIFIRQFEFFFEGLNLPQDVRSILRQRLIVNIFLAIGLTLAWMQVFHLLW